MAFKLRAAQGLSAAKWAGLGANKPRLLLLLGSSGPTITRGCRFGDFDGFARIIDVLGGVDISVDKRMYYPEEGIDLKAGQQHLNGHAALGYVRYRFDVDGDITRIGRQQKFLKALVDQTLSLRTVPRIPQLIAAVSQHVQTNLSSKEILSLAMTLKDIKSDAIQARTVPGTPLDINAGSFWQADQEKLSLILEEFRGAAPVSLQ